MNAVYKLRSDPSNVRALSVKTSAAFRNEVFSEKDKNMMVKYRLCPILHNSSLLQITLSIPNMLTQSWPQNLEEKNLDLYVEIWEWN